LLDPLEARMDALIATERYEAAAVARDQIEMLGEVLRQQQMLTALRRAPSTRFLAPSGFIELEHGSLRLAGDEPVPAPDRPLERDRLEELLLVVRWIERETTAGRIHRLDGDAS
jgi:hypothetical protein